MFICSQLLFAQNTPEKIIKDFFDTYKTDPQQAITDLYATNPWIKDSEGLLENLRNGVKSLTEETVGPFLGYDFISKMNLTENYVLYSYLAKYDRQPFKFTFQFYRPGDKWMIYFFNIDDTIDSEMMEAAKLQYLEK